MDRQEVGFNALFRPRNVAVVGASNTFGKIGGATLAAILSGEFRGEIYPVNPYESVVLGLKTYPNVSSIPGDVDLV
ncbi:MAG: CoA-binding protein, partial [Candidatus Jordarchaeaceae archaeon]